VAGVTKREPIRLLQRRCTACASEDQEIQDEQAAVGPRFAHAFHHVRVYADDRETDAAATRVGMTGPVVATAGIFGIGGGTDELHQPLVDEYARDTGQASRPGMQYTADYGKWLSQKGGTSPPPAKTPPPPPSPCKISVQYTNPKELDCDTIWKMNKGTNPSEPLCGGGILYDLTSVTATGSNCPNLTGLQVSEAVTGDQGCTPPGFVWPAPVPCTIGAGGKLTGCTDSYTLCGPTRNLQGNGCTEVVTQDVLVDGKVAQTHKITFKLTKTAKGCTGKVTRT
jgi:hypothetical protein